MGGVPVSARGRVFGNLYLTEKQHAEAFSDDEAGDPAGAAEDQAFERKIVDARQQLVAVADGADGPRQLAALIETFRGWMESVRRVENGR